MNMRPLKYSENPKLANDHKRNNLWIRGKTNGSHFITCSALQGASHVNREIHTGSLPRLGQRPSVIIGGGSRSVGQGRGGGGELHIWEAGALPSPLLNRFNRTSFGESCVQGSNRD